jgi:glycosyltransferase involved in cell wall biosynthesis
MALTIALVGPSHPFRGGIAHHTTLLYRHLAERHDVRFYTFTRQYPRWCFPGETDRDVSARPLRAPGVEPSLDSLNPTTWLRTAARVARLRPQLVIMPWWSSYWTPQFVTISRLLRRLTDTRLLAICHNVVDHEQRFVSRACARAVLAAMDDCLVHCRADELRLLALLPQAHVTRAFHPLYDFARPEMMSKSAARARLGIPGEAILFFGFVRPYKGLSHLVSAMPRILQRRRVTLLVVGEFWKGSEQFRRQVRDLGLDGAIRCVDRYVPNEEVGLYFSAADLIVLPYVAGTGSGVAQMAYGLDKPVVATRVGAMEEIIDDGQTGYLVPPAEPAALADAIVRFFEEGMEQPFVANIRRQKQRFSWERLVDIVERVAVNGGSGVQLAPMPRGVRADDDAWLGGQR